jgi:Na+/proline symporter
MSIAQDVIKQANTPSRSERRMKAARDLLNFAVSSFIFGVAGVGMLQAIWPNATFGWLALAAYAGAASISAIGLDSTPKGNGYCNSVDSTEGGAKFLWTPFFGLFWFPLKVILRVEEFIKAHL